MTHENSLDRVNRSVHHVWVLILFYLSSANASVAMHDFANQAACEHAREVAEGMQSGGLGAYGQYAYRSNS